MPHQIAAVIPWWAYVAVALLLAYPVGRGVFGVCRFAFSSWPTKRHYVLAWWVRLRWSWLTRNLGLIKVDRSTNREGKTVKTTTTPGVRIRPDRYGVVLTVRTVPGVGRKEWTAQAEHVGNLLGCRRVRVTQPRPGRLVVRAVRRDPLADALALADAPRRPRAPWTDYVDHRDPSTVYLGRDEFGVDRRLSLAGVPGLVLTGCPGYGKSSFVGGLLYQLAGLSSVQFCVLDGAGGPDYSVWEPRCWMREGDELDRAQAALEVLHDLLRYRVATIRKRLGVPNLWHVGPSDLWPLVVVVIDEAHTFFDLQAVKGDAKRIAKVMRLTSIVIQLAKQGRKAGLFTICASQKGTVDALPSALRDVLPVGVSFAQRTREASVAGLGEAVRQWPDQDPVTLLDRQFIGVCTAALPDLADAEPFTKLRTLHVTDPEIAARAMATAHCRTPYTELLDAQRWARTAPKPPASEWLLTASELAATNEQAGPAEQTPLRSVS